MCHLLSLTQHRKISNSCLKNISVVFQSGNPTSSIKKLAFSNLLVRQFNIKLIFNFNRQRNIRHTIFKISRFSENLELTCSSFLKRWFDCSHTAQYVCIHTRDHLIKYVLQIHRVTRHSIHHNSIEYLMNSCSSIVVQTHCTLKNNEFLRPRI